MPPASNPRTWGDYSPEEKEKAIYISANSLFQREYWSTGYCPHLEEKGLRFINKILPEPLERAELEAVLAPLPPGQEFHFCSYVRDLDALLLQEPTPFDVQPFYQRLEKRIEKLSEELDAYCITLIHFHTLLGIYILDQAREQGLVSASETQRDHFIKKANS